MRLCRKMMNLHGFSSSWYRAISSVFFKEWRASSVVIFSWCTSVLLLKGGQLLEGE
jgi:hypothetical protein